MFRLRLRLFRVLLTAALLSVGATTAGHAATGEAAEQADLVPSADQINDVALPAQGFIPAAAQTDLDLRSVRPATSVHGSRDRTRRLHAAPKAAPTASPESGAGYVAARLLRGGIDSSTLGTPPPQS